MFPTRFLFHQLIGVAHKMPIVEVCFIFHNQSVTTWFHPGTLIHPWCEETREFSGTQLYVHQSPSGSQQSRTKVGRGSTAAFMASSSKYLTLFTWDRTIEASRRGIEKYALWKQTFCFHILWALWAICCLLGSWSYLDKCLFLDFIQGQRSRPVTD